MSRASASLVSLAAYVLPYLLSRSSAPAPNHPRIWLWYKLLKKPRYTPPDIAFPVSWVAIETGLAWSSYRLLRRPASAARNTALALLAGNVLGIGAWSKLFFGNRNLPVSVAAAAALGTASAAYVVQARKVDTQAAGAAIPLTLWVCFAPVLTAVIWRKNR
jgi:tryptophan-rich sensory protein